MYRVLHFRGGMYRFDEVSEFVDDVGGLILSRDHFEITRGESYLSTEVHVLLMVPECDLKPLKLLITEIKGMFEDIDLKDRQKANLLLYLSVLDALNRNNSWTDKKHLLNIIKCPCFSMLCKGNECNLNEKIDEIIEEMNRNGIIESKTEHEKILYRLRKMT
ncbi:methyl-coenzyme M reductase family protein [Methanobacterium sp. ACI-7]|uniref:methyl-coenzyme M reductase family protein n=1 Tax=unclassified Methanobacterium TaxID=2627676 RepID=UPI0039C37C6C